MQHLWRYKILLITLGVLVAGLATMATLRHHHLRSDPTRGSNGERLPLQEPDISSLEPTLREQIAQARHVVSQRLHDPEALGRLGMSYHACDLLSPAEVCYNRALALSPQDHRWLYYLGLVQAASGHVEAAIANFEQMTTVRPDYLPAWLNLAELVLRAGDLHRAEIICSELLESTPNLPQAHVALGRIELRRGNLDIARRHYEQALQAAPGSRQALYALALVCRDLGDGERSQDLMVRATHARVSPSVPDSLRDALEQFRTGVVHHLHKGHRLLQAGESVAAAQEYRTALQIDPRSAEAHNGLGVALARQDKMAEAIEHHREALRLMPNFAEASYNLAIAYAREEDLREAVRLYRRTLAVQPNHAEAHNNLGVILLRQRHVQEAIEHLRSALGMQPADVVAYNNLGNAFLQARQFEEGIQVLREGLALDPTHRPIALTLASALATCPELNLRDGAGAVRLASELVETAENVQPRELGLLAAAYAEAGRWEEAIDTLQEAIHLAHVRGDPEIAGELHRYYSLYTSRQRHPGQ